ncbi:MAG: TetR/AcrR family transcriptional regulator [Bacteroidetes bacterium]|nr:TetR/AcrR family transcriptional regulator [Bacteroidota bacterium]
MISATALAEAYSDYLLEQGSAPKTVHAFAKIVEIEEAEFYRHFSSFASLEASIFQSFFDNALSLTLKEKEAGLDLPNELLSFYFSFFEILKANRSLVLLLLHQRPLLRNAACLKALRRSFLQYIDGLPLPMGVLGKLKEERLETIIQKGKGEGAWLQFMSFLDFWLQDDSPSFEKTDAFIEKSVQLGFRLMENPLLDELFDLGKFFVKERLKLFS